ncbi:hypothetical protein F4821DRAFT_236909 [Hypoxylon rubiginosum]|uniref:Uncharacterized protein n=1 Tax=Hypoxylon rubiginosum TaxID=110542 RepID=A0ACC0D3B3_9PEZI|nr:hypothetical protein F4821DRAFT_236909 [Hypoxylon rubiginosum]
MSTEEEKPFLEQVDANESMRGSRFLPFKVCRNRVLTVSLIANAVLLAICISLSVAVLLPSTPKSNNEILEPYSPASVAIEYEYHSMVHNDTRFVGHPGSDWEQATTQLMAGALIRISEDEQRLLDGSSSIPLKDGGYAAGLGVSHSLHCVKKIKQFLYHEHFYPDSTASIYEDLQSHADHCLDFLRQQVMCHVDYSVYTLYWGEKRQDIPTHRWPAVNKCTNWTKLHAWMLERAANTDMLVGP